MSDSGNNRPKTLFFFTDAFPLGWAEHYIEKEIGYLCAAFEKVYIFPLGVSDGEPRTLPDNASFVNIHSDVDFSKSNIFTTLLQDVGIVMEAMKADKQGFVSLYKTLFNARAYSRAIENFMKENSLQSEDVVCYSYWFYQWSLIVALLRKENIVGRAVSRVHFADLYQYVKKTPFARFKLRSLDKSILISQHGSAYFKKAHPDLVDKFEIGYLGVEQHDLAFGSLENETKIIVTCSTIRPQKRVDLIANCISKLKHNVRWVHYGTGPDSFVEELKAITKTFPENIEFDFKGWAKNEEVISFYKQNEVSLFVNLSTHEGVPVSIMEATSFGVPVIATDVFGTGEALSPKECVLLPVDSDEAEIVRVMDQMLNKNSDPNEVRKFSHTRFDAAKNYPDFIERHLHNR
jgi:glycosyltransferase involved in cell wall biosynthesis